MASAGNERFNDEAADWDKNPAVQEATRLAFDTLKPIIQALSERKRSSSGAGLDVLEVGCGTGLLTLRVAPLVREIVAVDPAHGMIDALKAKINDTANGQGTQDNSNNVVPVCRLLEDPEDPALPPHNPIDPNGARRKFDLILSHLVMHHVPDLKAFLCTLLGCLTPGGRVALTDFEDFGPEAIKFHPPSKLDGVERHGIPARWMEDLMKEVGFQDVKFIPKELHYFSTAKKRTPKPLPRNNSTETSLGPNLIAEDWSASPTPRLMPSPHYLAALELLPNEVLHLILGHFCAHCRGEHQQMSPIDHSSFGHIPCPAPQPDPNERTWYAADCRDLYSTCLASRRLHDIAQPILFHQFIPGYDYGVSVLAACRKWNGQLASFMRTVAQRQDLAAAVKRIFVHPSLLEPFQSAELTRSHLACENPEEVVSEVGTMLGIKEPHQLSGGDLLALLIAELPGLEHFSLRAKYYDAEIARPAALSATGISHLSLKTIDISLDTLYYPGRTLSLQQHVRALVELSPSLETLNVHVCKETWQQSSIPFLPNLKNICFTFSRLGEKDLESMLSSCNGLTSFFYQAGCRTYNINDDPWNGSDQFQLSHGVRYLGRHRATLRSLHLDLRERGESTWSPGTWDMSSFREFTALQHLTLNVEELDSLVWRGARVGDPELLIQLLPPSIVSFHLMFQSAYSDQPLWLERSLLGLADAAARGEFQNLKQVKWDKDWDLKRVQSIFAASGVRFGYDGYWGTRSTLGDHGWRPRSPDAGQWMPLPDEDDADL
ncbi:class I SAM-dependent methyltransferase [Aspergillus mulundensis]|uniref:Methyltransferase domain-containing protein n=1 Tax=Aspergillus mulundensis TaxID=1810919 RepID=A0A3D8RYN4_9EURO|nr:hypothetical protein DSM5745_05822 [Aspergillus mulundensis]RDW78970.1 hypothetical protein DSM5745_05822 [Aspergillus mulundensis]